MGTETVVFSEEQQAAILGHTLGDSTLLERLRNYGVDNDWFVTNRMSNCWKLFDEFYQKFSRAPQTSAEVAEYCDNLGNDAAYKKSVEAALRLCETSAASHKSDVLDLKIITWVKARTIAARAKEVEAAFNKGDHDAASAIIEKAAIDLRRIEVMGGVIGDDFKSAADRSKEESKDRAKQADRVLNYSIKYLDEALGGIIPNDLVLIGASSGTGKSDLARSIGEANAREGKRVSFFALEAEPGEMERRIKYSLMAHEYKRQHPGMSYGYINYLDWRMNRGTSHQELGKMEDWAQQKFDAELSNLKTYYRVREDFNTATLEKKILKVSDETDLFILDHLHYVDIDGRDEHSEMHNLVKKLRDLIILLEKPVIAVAHLRKNREKRLVPDLDDFHGISSIQKIATTAIMLSRARNVIAPTGGGSPTYFRIAKCRLDGDRLYNVAVTYFDKGTGYYKDPYSLGVLNGAETKWVPSGTETPYWAKNATITDVSAGE